MCCKRKLSYCVQMKAYINACDIYAEPTAFPFPPSKASVTVTAVTAQAV